MTDETGSTGGEAIADTGGELTLAQAVQLQTQERQSPKDKETPAESAEPATAETELAQANDGPETVPAEEPEGDDPEAEKLPPIERPRSWSKDDDDDWNALPRTRQEKIATHERAREADINRRINDAAEKLKGLTAKEQQAEQARQGYESRQAEYTKALETALQADFGDIQNLNDVRNLQANDPFRFQAWQVRQMELSSAQAEKQQVDTRNASERRSSWEKFVQEESKAFADDMPEYKAKKGDYDKKAAETLRDLGFTDQELDKLASGEEKIPLFDRRIQRLLFDRIKLSEIQSAPKAIATRPVPPVQRPGASKPQGSTASVQLQALNERFTRDPTLKNAQALHAAEVRVAGRRAT